jgi:hypothetical protein
MNLQVSQKLQEPILRFVVMGLTYIVPMTKTMDEFIKFTRSYEIFMCDFVGVMKVC